MRSFDLEIDGHVYRAAWKVERGSVVVTSPYGATEAPLQGEDPAVVARQLLQRVVRAMAYRRG